MKRKFENLVRDEAGMTMGLAVIMVVLIGVMGAGLLTFVQRDLNSVVEVNQGQKALDLADAGVEAAQHHLWVDNVKAHYDVDTLTRPDYRAACDVPATDKGEKTSPPENWSPEGGVTKTFADGSFTVTVRWLGSNTDPVCKSPVAPEPGTDYFLVTSTGNQGDATRKVESIFSTEDNGAPRAFYAEKNITLSGGSCIKDVSLFTPGDVTINGGAEIYGEDLAYQKWASPTYANPYNKVERKTNAAGIGAGGTINPPGRGADKDNPKCGGSGSGLSKNFRDYDSTTTPKFVAGSPSSGQMTYPFKPTLNNVDANALCERAKIQESATGDGAHYQPVGKSGNYNLNTWPVGGTDTTTTSGSTTTIVCVDYTGGNTGKAIWDVDGTSRLSAPYDTNCEKPIRRGILVVRNGNFETGSNKALFSGVVVVRGGSVADGDFKDTGSSTCLEGFANTSDEITINGNVQPYSTLDLANTPGFHSVTPYSWRELYE